MDSFFSDDERLMTPENIHWHTFLRQLKGPEGINLYFEGLKAKWSCSHHSLRPLTRKILAHFKDIDVDATLKVFSELRGKCDCEVVFNVEDAFWKQMGGGELLLKHTKKDKP
jgi:hypothetical protein